MKNLHRRVELLANLGILVIALLLGITLVNRYLRPASPGPEATQEMRVKPGTKLSLSGMDWQRSENTLLMVLSTNCHFCSESSPFYQRLAQERVGGKEVRLVAVLPQPPAESEKYLAEHGINVDEIRQSTPGAVYAKATPTLILVDRTGAVVQSWVGKLPAEKEAEVISLFARAPVVS